MRVAAVKRLHGVSNVCFDLFSSVASILLETILINTRLINFWLFFIGLFKLLVTRMPAFIIMTFSKCRGLEFASSISVSRVTFLTHFLTLSSL